MATFDEYIGSIDWDDHDAKKAAGDLVLQKIGRILDNGTVTKFGVHVSDDRMTVSVSMDVLADPVFVITQ